MQKVSLQLVGRKLSKIFDYTTDVYHVVSLVIKTKPLDLTCGRVNWIRMMSFSNIMIDSLSQFPIYTITESKKYPQMAEAIVSRSIIGLFKLKLVSKIQEQVKLKVLIFFKIEEVHFILSSLSMCGKIFSTMFLHVEVIPSKIEFVNENLCTRFKWPLPSPVIKQLIWKSGETGQ